MLQLLKSQQLSVQPLMSVPHSNSGCLGGTASLSLQFRAVLRAAVGLSSGHSALSCTLHIVRDKFAPIHLTLLRTAPTNLLPVQSLPSKLLPVRSQSSKSVCTRLQPLKFMFFDGIQRAASKYKTKSNTKSKDECPHLQRCSSKHHSSKPYIRHARAAQMRRSAEVQVLNDAALTHYSDLHAMIADGGKAPAAMLR
jgi:hypothetical protein